jgi:transposase-like protein
MAKRRNFSAAFKAKVTPEALRGDQTLAEMARFASPSKPTTGGASSMAEWEQLNLRN